MQDPATMCLINNVSRKFLCSYLHRPKTSECIVRPEQHPSAWCCLGIWMAKQPSVALSPWRQTLTNVTAPCDLRCRLIDRTSRLLNQETKITMDVVFARNQLCTWARGLLKPPTINSNSLLWLATELNLKLLLRKLGLYHILSPTAEMVNMDEEGTPNTISPGSALIALQSDVEASWKSSNAVPQLEHAQELAGETPAMDLHSKTGNAKQGTGSVGTQWQT